MLMISMTNEDLHDRAVLAIAKERFRYPDKDNPDWKTWINTNEKRSMGVKANGDFVYSDIIVTDSENKVIMAGEIETESTISEEGVKQWKQCQELCGACFVYVPEGYEEQSRELFGKGNFSVSGLRTYRFDGWNIIISNM